MYILLLYCFVNKPRGLYDIFADFEGVICGVARGGGGVGGGCAGARGGGV